MIEIKLEESSSLTLEMRIEGDAGQDTPQLRFSVISEGLRYSFDSVQTSDGVYQIEFPTMLGKLSEGVYPAEVEIILDGKHFVPLEETVRFTREVKPTVKLAEAMAQVQKETEVKVKMGTLRVAAAKTTLSDVRGLVASLQENAEIDTAFALAALNKFALNESATLGEFHIKPKKALAESEAIAALRLIGAAESTDVTADEIEINGIRAISEKVTAQLRHVLSAKGVSARGLKGMGF